MNYVAIYIFGMIMFGLVFQGLFLFLEGGPGIPNYKKGAITGVVCAVLWPVAVPLTLLFLIYIMVYIAISL